MTYRKKPDFRAAKASKPDLIVLDIVKAGYAKPWRNLPDKNDDALKTTSADISVETGRLFPCMPPCTECRAPHQGKS